MKRILKKYIAFQFFVIMLIATFANIDLRESAQETFSKIESAFSSNNISSIAELVDNTTFISLSNGVVGYFSSDQTINILKKFLEENKPLQFNLTNKKTETRKPFATGNFIYVNNGIRKQSRVFVSMYLSGENWIISQITIN